MKRATCQDRDVPRCDADCGVRWYIVRSRSGELVGPRGCQRDDRLMAVCCVSVCGFTLVQQVASIPGGIVVGVE